MTERAPSAPHVTGLFTATEAAAPIAACNEVMLVAGVGVEGDRYASRRGRWSDPRWQDQELTLVQAEVAEALGVEPGALRRNIVTRGVDLNNLIGLRLAIGETLIDGARPCDPCAYIERLNARPGLLKALAGHGGLRARIVRGGRIRVGDAIAIVGIVDAEAAGADPAATLGR